MDLNEKAEGTTQDEPEIVSDVVSGCEKKKSIDEMIEQFNRDNPSKNQKKIHRGVF